MNSSSGDVEDWSFHQFYDQISERNWMLRQKLTAKIKLACLHKNKIASIGSKCE